MLELYLKLKIICSIIVFAVLLVCLIATFIDKFRR